MEIKLVNAPTAPFKTPRCDLFKWKSPMYSAPSLVLAQLTTFLEKNKIKVEQVDLNSQIACISDSKKFDLNMMIKDENLEKIVTNKAINLYLSTHINRLLDLTKISKKHKLVGFSVIEPRQLALTLILAKKIKELFNSKIVLGGPNITSMCTEPDLQEREKMLTNFFQKATFVDYLIFGAGEKALLHLVRYLTGNAKDIDDMNIVTKDIFPSDAPFKKVHYPIRNLDGLPVHEFKELYAGQDYFYYPLTMGCLYNCAFCSSRFIDPIPFCKDPKMVVDDLMFLKKKYAIDNYIFGADMINIDPNHLESVCDLIISKKLKIKWIGIAAPKNITSSLFKKMKDAGCFEISFGSESGSPKVLKSMNKPYSIEEVEYHVKTAHKYGLRTVLYFLIGFPTETEEDFNLTGDFMIRNQEYVTIVTLNKFHLDRNSPVYFNPEKYGIKRIWENKHSPFLPYWVNFSYNKPDQSFSEITSDINQRINSLKELLKDTTVHPIVHE